MKMRMKRRNENRGWRLIALVAGGVAALMALYSVGPDLIRYARIKTM